MVHLILYIIIIQDKAYSRDPLSFDLCHIELQGKQCVHTFTTLCIGCKMWSELLNKLVLDWIVDLCIRFTCINVLNKLQEANTNIIVSMQYLWCKKLPTSSSCTSSFSYACLMSLLLQAEETTFTSE